MIYTTPFIIITITITKKGNIIIIKKLPLITSRPLAAFNGLKKYK